MPQETALYLEVYEARRARSNASTPEQFASANARVAAAFEAVRAHHKGSRQ